MRSLTAYFKTGKNYYLFFLMSVFIFISSSALALSPEHVIQTSIFPDVKFSKSFPPIPVLKSKNAFQKDLQNYPVLSAQGVMAIDLDSASTLYEKNADAPLLPASTTKIITSLVALDVFNPDTVLTVGREVIVEGQKMGLYPGEQMLVSDLIAGLLVYSANDAAMTLAQNHPDGYTGFVNAMNQKAKLLSMTNTRFDNPIGLDGNSQRSTAKDLVRASEVAMRNPTFAKIVGTKEIEIKDVSGKVTYNLKNLNVLLGSTPGVIGIKTGWTESARENLVTYLVRDNHKIVIAILGSTDRFGETKELIDWIFSNYNWIKVEYPYSG